MITAYLERRRNEFRTWWRAPIRPRDRFLGMVIGALGAFWIGALGRIIVGELRVSLAEVAGWGVGCAIAGATMGAVVPKHISVLLFPFSTFGPSP